MADTFIRVPLDNGERYVKTSPKDLFSSQVGQYVDADIGVALIHSVTWDTATADLILEVLPGVPLSAAALLALGYTLV